MSPSVAEFQSEVAALAANCRRDTTLMGTLSDQFQRLAETAATDPDLERQAAREAAMAYRLYAAYLILRPGEIPKPVRIRDAAPWMQRAAMLAPSVADASGLNKAVGYFSDLAAGTEPPRDTGEYLKHLMRLGMVEASDHEVAQEVAGYLGYTERVTEPQAGGGASLSDDVDFLEEYRVDGPSMHEALMGLKLNLQLRFGARDVGSVSASYVNRMDNGNTCVRYEFMGDEPILLEFEVSKDNNLVTPTTEVAEVIMRLVRGET